MAKKAKSKKVPCKLLSLGLLLISIVVACMVFLPGISIGEDFTVAGLQTVFGGTVTKTAEIGGQSVTTELGETAFNVGAFFGFILPVILCLVYFIIDKVSPKAGRVLVILPAAGFIASAVLCFLTNKLFVTANDGSVVIQALNLLGAEFKLGVGPIVAGSVAIVGALTSLYGCYAKLAK